MSLAKYSIGTKIFGAFIAMSAVIALLGAAGYGVLFFAGKMAVTTFDGPLMAINYARAAQSDFIMLQMAELRFEHADAQEREAIADRDRRPRHHLRRRSGRGRAALHERRRKASDPRDQPTCGALAGPARRKQYRRAGKNRPAGRRQIRSSDRTQYRSQLCRPPPDRQQCRRPTNISAPGATLVALLLAGAITLFLRSRIVRPLAAAAMVADRIAKRRTSNADSASAAPTKPAHCSNP